jgi:hypothetical protein
MGKFAWILLGILVALPAQAVTVLHVGDSHSVGPFGRILNQRLRDRLSQIPGSTVGLYGSCGSIARWWFTGTETPCGYLFVGKDGVADKGLKAATPLVSDLLAQYKPDITLVELSGNYVVGYEQATAVADMKRMVRTVLDSGSRCLWIAQPDTQKYRSEHARILAWVQEAIGADCPIVDGAQFTHYPDGMADGVHYGSAWGEAAVTPWVDEVMRQLELMLPPS